MGAPPSNRRPYPGSRRRVYGPALAAFLLLLVPVVALALHTLGLGLTDIARGPPFETEPAWPPWYAWFALAPAGIVPGAMIQYRVSRLPCPRCGSSAVRCYEGKAHWEVSCSRCRQVWETKIGISRATEITDNHHHHHPM